MNIEINEPIESALVGICTDDGYDAYQHSRKQSGQTKPYVWLLVVVSAAL